MPDEPVRPTVTPHYWDEACKHLSKRDRVMRKLIPQFGEGRLQSRGDAFTTLARSIVGQQISVKAAQAVWERFAALVDGRPTRVRADRPCWPRATAHARGGAVGAQGRIPARPGPHFESGKVHVRNGSRWTTKPSSTNW
jgi:DNA-3-methyladenine glycosylase II